MNQQRQKYNETYLQWNRAERLFSGKPPSGCHEDIQAKSYHFYG
jgi:hypothetical protein